MIIQEDEEKYLNSTDELTVTLTVDDVEVLTGVLGEYLDERFDKSVNKVYDKLLLLL